MTLRIGFDVDGVVADMDSALTRQAQTLFGSPVNLTSRQQQKLWRQIEGVENFWQHLDEVEPGAVRLLAAAAAAHRWEVIFLTKRQQTRGASAQLQTQRWLVANGFERPSVFVVQGSRGRIAAALALDVVVDDRVENCFDVVVDSTAKTVLVWRNAEERLPAAAERLGIRVVHTLGEWMNSLIEPASPTMPK